jgi:osmotically inducible protein OsmC
MTIAKVLYTAHAKVTGGRDGHATSSDGLLDVKLAVPKEMGGPGGGTNPEQLFAVGYAACFLGAMRVVAAQREVSLPVSLSIDSSVGIGQIKNGFGIEAALRINIPGMNSTEAESLVEAAHRVCPYSNATRNNIDVRLIVITE